jgi:hypothetical protein
VGRFWCGEIAYPLLPAREAALGSERGRLRDEDGMTELGERRDAADALLPVAAGAEEYGGARGMREERGLDATVVLSRWRCLVARSTASRVCWWVGMSMDRDIVGGISVAYLLWI